MSNLECGWLSPDGTLYCCNWGDHIAVAGDLVEAFGYVRKLDEHLRLPASDDVLLENRWAHITLSLIGMKEWRIYWYRSLTDSQKTFLKPYFEDEIPVPSYIMRQWKNETEI